MCIVNSEFIDWTVVCVCSVHACIACKLWTKQRGRIQAANGFTAITAYMALAYGNDDAVELHTHFFRLFFFFRFPSHFKCISRSSSATFCRLGFVLYSFDFVLRFIAVVVVVFLCVGAGFCDHIKMPLDPALGSRLCVDRFASSSTALVLLACTATVNVCNVLNVQQRFRSSDDTMDAS